MTRQQLTDEIVEVIYECVPELEGSLQDGNTVISTGSGVDSMSFTLVICRLEEKYGVRIPNREWSKLRTLGDVVDAIEKRIT